MSFTRPIFRSQTQNIVNQVLAIIVQNRPFDERLAASVVATRNTNELWTIETVSEVLRSIPRFFFQSTRSVGRQKGFRHRAPLKQIKLLEESQKARMGVLVLGPGAYRDPEKVNLGLYKALEFYLWVESHFGFSHNELTCREMALVLARANTLKDLWEFLKEMSKKNELVSTSTITCLIKVLGEEGFVNEALATFYRMKQFRCKHDVYAYNTIINALCRVGYFKKAKHLLWQMEVPGFRCPPDTFTYTIFINAFCRYGMETGCRKATSRRMWEANHFFRIMLFKGFVPDVVTYNCLINGCCKTYRIERALELFDDMGKRGCLPNRVTYNSFIRYYSSVNEIDKAIEMLRRMQKMNHGVPTTSSYTPIIHSLCESGRMQEARDFLSELVEGGSIPREYTYTRVCDLLDSAGKTELLDAELRREIEHGIKNRFNQMMKVKAVMRRELHVHERF